MDRLSQDKQDNIKKMSTERLIIFLTRAGLDEETVLAMDRPQMMETWAELVAEGKDKPQEASKIVGTLGADSEWQKRMYELEMMKFQAERQEKRRREEAEREERQAEREEKRRREEFEREKFEEERRIREEELQLRKEEIARAAKRDKEYGEKKQSLASRTKFYGEAMKNVFWKFPHDPAEIPGYFDHVENLFDLYEVDGDVKSKLLQSHLNDKAKALTVRLSRDQLDDYDALKSFLLNEFKISPNQLRERFYMLQKSQDETYTLLASKLRNALIYYLRSRKIIDSFDDLVSLLCADRLKELIPKGCLDFILAQEKENWLPHDALAHSIDIYMSTHEADGSPVGLKSRGFNFKTDKQNKTNNHSFHPQKIEATAEQKADSKPGNKFSKEEIMKKGLCFVCHERGHISKDCKKRPIPEANKKVNTCAADPSPALALLPETNDPPY